MKEDKVEDENRSSDDGDDWVKTTQGGGRDAAHKKGSQKSTGDQESADEGQPEPHNDSGGKSKRAPLEVEADGENAPLPEASAGAEGKKRSYEKGDRGDRVDGVGDDEARAKKLQHHANKKRGRLVPGSIVLTSLSASAMPNTEKGVFSKQVLVWTPSYV